MRVMWSTIGMVLLSCSLVCAADPLRGEKGVIRDARTAVTVGEAILVCVYGRKALEADRPYRADLEGDRWHVYHPLPAIKSGEMAFGGGYRITLSRKDGRVIEIGFDE